MTNQVPDLKKKKACGLLKRETDVFNNGVSHIYNIDFAACVIMAFFDRLFYYFFICSWPFSHRYINRMKGVLKYVLFVPILLCVIYFTSPSLRYV